MCWSILLNGVIVAAITALMVLWELRSRYRPFPWLPILRSLPFGLLVVLQGGIAFAFLAGLAASGRAKYSSYVDAVWVSLAGISLLRTIQGAKPEESNRLWALADWLFGHFYRQCGALITRQSELFRRYLRERYNGNPDAFWEQVVLFINWNDTKQGPAEVAALRDLFDRTNDPVKRVDVLANYVAPRSTRHEWDMLNPP